MTFTNSLSIRSKLLGAFAVLLLVGGLGATSLQRAADTSYAVQDMIDNYYGSLIHLETMRADVLRMRAIICRGLIGTEDKAESDRRIAAFTTAAAEYVASDSNYSPPISPSARAADATERNPT